MENYYQNQLNKIKTTKQVNVKVSGENNETNYMDLNKESATILINWLKESFIN